MYNDNDKDKYKEKITITITIALKENDNDYGKFIMLPFQPFRLRDDNNTARMRTNDGINSQHGFKSNNSQEGGEGIHSVAGVVV